MTLNCGAIPILRALLEVNTGWAQKIALTLNLVGAHEWPILKCLQWHQTSLQRPYAWSFETSWNYVIDLQPWSRPAFVPHTSSAMTLSYLSVHHYFFLRCVVRKIGIGTTVDCDFLVMVIPRWLQTIQLHVWDWCQSAKTWNYSTERLR